MSKKGVVCLVLLILISPVYAARLHGTVYDLSLDKISGVIVELNTTPQQRVISKEGTYSFNLNPGNYKITAQEVSQNLTLTKAEEKIQIIEDGDYTLDLFLYPSLEEEESLMNSTDIDIGEEPPSILLPVLIIIIALLIIVISFLVFIYIKSKKTPIRNLQPVVDDELEKVIQIIKTEGNRTTQKEIRKQLPLSEAKVSLIITELESKGIIEKIKKGRGNIIILRKQP